MRHYLFAVPLAFLAAPAVAAQPVEPEPIRIPPELSDPQFIERIAGMTEALSKALLDLPIGDIEAAVEGRPAGEADRRRTVRDLGSVSDPNFERDVQRQLAEARPRLKAAMEALAKALPSMSKALSQAASEVERATANVPQPGYPRR